MEKSNPRGIRLSEEITVILFALYYLLPSFTQKWNIAQAIAACLIYIIIYCANMDIRHILKILALSIIVSSLYSVLVDSTTISSSVGSYGIKEFLSKFYELLTMLFPVILLDRVLLKATHGQKIRLCIMFSAIIAYVLLTTLVELQANPNATKSWEFFAETGSRNVGNYYHIYAIPPIIALSATLFFDEHKGWLKLLYATLCAFLFYFLLLGQYTLSVLVSALVLSYIIWINCKHTLENAALLFIAAIVVLFLPDILLTLSNSVPSEQISIRLRELSLFFRDGDASGYNLSSRLTLYWRTIKAFAYSPIWGNRTLPFNGHATFLVVLADLGLLGGVPFFYLYFSQNSYIKNHLTVSKGKYSPVFIAFVLSGFVNPIHHAIPLAFTALFYVPLVLSMVYDDKEDEYERY